MNVLVTGALGFTARHLISKLRTRRPAVIFGTDLPPHGGNAGLDAYWPANLTDRHDVAGLLRRAKPDWIFHLAGRFHGSATDLYDVNLMSAIHLLEAVKTDHSGAALLLVGSAAEYGIWPASEMPLGEDHPCRPVNAYGLSKQAMTLAAQYWAANCGVKVVVARPFNLIGAGMPASLVVGALVERAKSALAAGESTIRVGNTQSRRDFVSIEDAVEAYIRLLETGAWGEVFNVCSGDPRSIAEIIQILLAFSPRTIEAVEDKSLMRPNDPPLSVGDPSRIRRLCGFCASAPLEEALRQAWDASQNQEHSSVVQTA